MRKRLAKASDSGARQERKADDGGSENMRCLLMQSKICGPLAPCKNPERQGTPADVVLGEQAIDKAARVLS